MPWRPRRDSRASWPVVLRDAERSPTVILRPLQADDEREWHRVRRDNAPHVKPWEPTLPPGAEIRPPVSFKQFVRELDQEALADRAMPWAIEVDGHIAGQVHIFGIIRAAQQSGAVGYWLAEPMTGRGIATRAVALALDHALGPGGLHRVEVNIRDDNARSLALVARLGLREEGVRLRYLHIDGQWRDHRSFAVTADEIAPGGLIARVSHV